MKLDFGKENGERYAGKTAAGADVHHVSAGTEADDFGNAQGVEHVMRVEIVDVLAGDDVDLRIPVTVEGVELGEVLDLLGGELGEVASDDVDSGHAVLGLDIVENDALWAEELTYLLVGDEDLDDPDSEGGDLVGIVRIGHTLVIEAEVIIARQVGSVDTILALHLLRALAAELLDECTLKDLIQLGAIAVDEEVSFADDVLALAVEGIVPRARQAMGSPAE